MIGESFTIDYVSTHHVSRRVLSQSQSWYAGSSVHDSSWMGSMNFGHKAVVETLDSVWCRVVKAMRRKIKLPADDSDDEKRQAWGCRGCPYLCMCRVQGS